MEFFCFWVHLKSSCFKTKNTPWKHPSSSFFHRPNYHMNCFGPHLGGANSLYENLPFFLGGFPNHQLRSELPYLHGPSLMVTSWGLVGFFRCFLQMFIIDPRWVQEFFHEQYQYISIYIFVHKNMYMLTQISCCVMEFSGIHENKKMQPSQPWQKESLIYKVGLY